MAWRVAKSLIHWRDQINAKVPSRNRRNDGTIGDAAHSARVSDHNPDTDGVVKAMDITNDPGHGVISRHLAEAIVASRDDRVKYIISNRQIIAGSGGPNSWKWRAYSGTNPHTEHVHLSVRKQASYFDNVRDWALPPEISGLHPPPVPSRAPAAPGIVWDGEGRGSWYSQFRGNYIWRDTGDRPNSNALGVNDIYQGVSFYNRDTLGKWFLVEAPNGRRSIEQQTDIGPNPRLNRKIDISAAAAERFGYAPNNFPTDSIFKWKSIESPVDIANLDKKLQAIRYHDSRLAAVNANV